MLETAPHAPVTYASKSAKSIGDMFRIRVRWSGSMPALYEKRGGTSTWAKTTWTGFYDDARRVLAGLLAVGLTKGDKVAMAGKDIAWSWNWVISNDIQSQRITRFHQAESCAGGWKSQWNMHDDVINKYMTVQAMQRLGT